MQIAFLNEELKDLNNFIVQHKNLKVIGFNGKNPETIFDKYFTRNRDILYISLPCISRTNTAIDFDMICAMWQRILK